MGRLLAFGSLLALSVWATALAQEAQPPLTFHPVSDTQPARVGQRVRVTLDETWTIKNEQTLEGDAAPFTLDQRRTLHAVYEREVLDVKGREVQAYELTFSAWTLQRGEQAHEGLAGRSVVLRRPGQGGTLQREASPTDLPPPAARFVERLARELSRPDLGTFVPARALKAGDTWEVSAEAAAPHLVEDARLDSKRSNVRGHLQRLYTEGGKSRGEVRIKADLALKTLPGTDTRVVEGGMWSVKTSYDWALGEPLTRANVKRNVRFKGKGRNKRPDGRRFVVETQARCQHETKVEALPDR